jgi:hypothetical protein
MRKPIFIFFLILACGLLTLSFTKNTEGVIEPVDTQLPNGTINQQYYLEIAKCTEGKCSCETPSTALIAPLLPKTVKGRFYAVGIPDGLNLSKDCLLSGLPTKVGNWMFSVDIREKGSHLFGVIFYISILSEEEKVALPPGLIPSILTGQVPPGTVNQSYYFKFEAGGGCDPTQGYQWQIRGELPEGLTFNSNQGTIFGTPLQIETKEFSLRVRDVCAQFSDFTSFQIIIYPDLPLRILTPALPSEVINQPYRAVLEAGGGRPPYQWELVFVDRGGKPFENPATWLNLIVPAGKAEKVYLEGQTPSQPGEYLFGVLVKDYDNQNQDQRDYLIKITKVEVEVPSIPICPEPGSKQCPICPEEERGGLVPCDRGCDDPNTEINECCACQFCHLFVMLNRILDFIFFILVPPIAALMLVIGGVLFFTSGGDPFKITQAKRLITSTIIGLILIYGAWGIVNTTLMWLGLAEWTGYETWWEISCP